MDCHSARFTRWQVDLPLSVRIAEFASRLNYRSGLRPASTARLGIAGFVGCGMAVVVMASVLALSI